MKLLVATNNKGKLSEYRALLGDLPVDVVSPADLGLRFEPEETGATFAENAEIKARACAEMTGMVSLADDSGLEVDALGGEPGVFSARYGGPEGSDTGRYELLLRNIQSVPWERRSARFTCVVAVVDPSDPEGVNISDGVCEGFVARAPRGGGGFGYDPVFYLPEYDRTMAELLPEEKNSISHRARAVRAAAIRLAQRYFPGHSHVSGNGFGRPPVASEVGIRPMTANDLFAVSRTCFPEQRDWQDVLSRVTDESRQGRAVSLVAAIGDEPVGYAELQIRGRVGSVRQLRVTARVEQRSVTLAMAHVLIQVARERGLAVITGRSDRDEPAAGWYRRLGFRAYRQAVLLSEEVVFLKKGLN